MIMKYFIAFAYRALLSFSLLLPKTNGSYAYRKACISIAIMAATFTEADVEAKLATYGVPFAPHSTQKPLYNDQNSFLIKTLCKVYNTHTGENAKPIAIGGGTYARALKLGAGFGPEFGKEPSTVHQANENVKKADFALVYPMYYDAIKLLAAGESDDE